jgi:hypothetical protein
MSCGQVVDSAVEVLVDAVVETAAIAHLVHRNRNHSFIALPPHLRRL